MRQGVIIVGIVLDSKGFAKLIERVRFGGETGPQDG